MTSDNIEDKGVEPGEGESVSRRDVLKGLATVPVLGAFAYAYFRKRRYEKMLRGNILKSVDMTAAPPEHQLPPESGRTIRLGLIGFGIRGPQIAKAAGFLHPDDVDALREASLTDTRDTRYAEFMGQDDLNIEIRGVCDIFSVYAEKARVAGSNI